MQPCRLTPPFKPTQTSADLAKKYSLNPIPAISNEVISATLPGETYIFNFLIYSTQIHHEDLLCSNYFRHHQTGTAINPNDYHLGMHKKFTEILLAAMDGRVIATWQITFRVFPTRPNHIHLGEVLGIRCYVKLPSLSLSYCLSNGLYIQKHLAILVLQ